MNTETCVSYSDMTSMDSYYSASAAAQGRDHQADHFRTFPATDTKYSPTAFLPNKGQAYGEKSRSPFQQECQSLDAAAAGQGTFGKYHLFMQRSSCKTSSEEGKLHPERGHNGGLIPCYALGSIPATADRTDNKQDTVTIFHSCQENIGDMRYKQRSLIRERPPDFKQSDSSRLVGPAGAALGKYDETSREGFGRVKPICSISNPAVRQCCGGGDPEQEVRHQNMAPQPKSTSSIAE
ncbi:unnamed protein product [Pleuronectes platessa]|uniref:Uncharacterized protein n=1 Tax=Pleuronectes platessa TaxID=8262 RepID=A0A9N7VGS9_PLEPL|nr:unnamed protein product [Pleuronectes platessa]